MNTSVNIGPTQLDIINPNGPVVQGSIAEKLLKSNFNVNALRTQDVLRKDEWVSFDEAIIEVARSRLIGVQDLIDRGLTHFVPNAMGKTKLEWERVSDMQPAEISMGGVTQGQNDRPLFDLKAIPLPIIHRDFSINIRALEASRDKGESLDTTSAKLAVRLVSEKIEDLLFNGSNIAGTSFTIPGYTTAANRNTGSVTASWLTTTGANIVGDTLDMIDDAKGDNMYGPYILYVPTAVHTAMQDDYKAESDKTILQRVKEIDSISDVRPTNDLTASNILLVQMTSDVVDMIDGIQPTAVQWESNGGFTTNFKVLAIMVPRIRDDYTDQSGIVHYS